MKTQLKLNLIPKWMFIPVLFASVLLFSHCSDQGREKMNESLNDFKSYVKEHKESANKYADRKWDELDREYNEKKEKLDKHMDKMDKEMKDSYNETVAEWDSFKNDFNAMQEEKARQEEMSKLRTTLVPSGVESDLTNITGSNILSVYKHFVNTVNTNKDAYSKEEWTAINDHWKHLNDIKDRLEKEKAISQKDNREIVKLKLEYTGIKAVNRPFAASENP